jgi:hypothetical protein
MISTVFLASLALMWYSLRRRRVLKKSGSTETLAFKLLGHSLEFSACLAGVLLVYYLLLAWLISGWQGLSAETLLKLENRLVSTQEVLEHYKLSWTTALVILVILYVMGLTRLGFFRHGRHLKSFLWAKKALQLLNLIIALLCSFTLLGSQPGKAAATLQIHFREERTNYGVLRSEIKNALGGSAATKAVDRLMRELPGGSAVVLQTMYDLEHDSERLIKTYDQAKNSYGIRDVRTESDLQRENKREDALKASPDASHADKSAPISAQSPIVPDKVTYRGVENAQREVRSFIERSNPQLLRVLSRPEGKEIVLHMADFAPDKLSDVLSDSIGKICPLFKPIIEAIMSGFSDLIQKPIERELDKVAESVIEHPNDVDTLLDKFAAQACDSAHLEMSPDARRRYLARLHQLQADAKSLKANEARLMALMKDADTRAMERFVMQLYSPREQVREDAARALSERGKWLSLSQVRRLIGEMRHGVQKWITSAKREGHCTSYQSTSIRYYAAEALQNMRSQYLDTAISEEATKAQMNARSYYSITDRGWI